MFGLSRGRIVGSTHFERYAWLVWLSAIRCAHGFGYHEEAILHPRCATPPGAHSRIFFASVFLPPREAGRTADFDLYFGCSNLKPNNKRRDTGGTIQAGQ